MAAISFPQPYVPKGLVKTLTSLEALEKKFSLPELPEYPALVRLIPGGGIEQINGVDFSVLGDLVQWSELGLEGFLEEGDVILVFY